MVSRANFYKKFSIGGNYQLAPQAILESRILEIHISREGLLVVAVLEGIPGGDQDGFWQTGRRPCREGFYQH